MIDPRAVALQGLGFEPLSISVLGWVTVAAELSAPIGVCIHARAARETLSTDAKQPNEVTLHVAHC